MTPRQVAVAVVALVVTIVVLAPIIPDGSAFCASNGECPLPVPYPPTPYVSVLYSATGVGIIHDGAQLIFVYTPWTCGAATYAGGVVTAYGCSRGSMVLYGQK